MWTNCMFPKLKQFFEECMLPEIADPRIPRGLKAPQGGNDELAGRLPGEGALTTAFLHDHPGSDQAD
ncbi:hypothetical protein PR048_007595 [Dryococelus australis]|uniref:Uncharacterized protein n=1 Tax=Dryococelus australis TaxID=614101 RepID=A0ABQ9HUP3_9NEOP|nr:hypothetical protein PR048_007595 [Dryococelus australis]